MLAANLPIGGFLSQLQPMLLDRRFEVATAAGIGSLFAGAIALGRLGSGWLVDRLWAPAVAGFFLCLPAIGALVLVLVERPSVALAGAAAAFLGLAQGAEADFLAYLVPKYFGLRSYGAIFGSLLMIVSLALASGAVFFGLTHDHFGSYRPALVVSIGAYLTAAACILASGISRSRTRALSAPATLGTGGR